MGYAIRHVELRPYQQMQTYLLRKKLELLEHAIEHAAEHAAEHAMDAAGGISPEELAHLEEEREEIEKLRFEIAENAQRLSKAFGVNR